MYIYIYILIYIYMYIYIYTYVYIKLSGVWGFIQSKAWAERLSTLSPRPLG